MLLKEVPELLLQMACDIEKLDPEVLDCAACDISVQFVTGDDGRLAAIFARDVGRTNKTYHDDHIFISHDYHNNHGSCVGKIVTLIPRELACVKRVVKKILPAEPAKPEREVEEIVWDCQKKPVLGPIIAALGSSQESIEKAGAA
jgi:hypothetical protein